MEDADSPVFDTPSTSDLVVGAVVGAEVVVVASRKAPSTSPVEEVEAAVVDVVVPEGAVVAAVVFEGAVVSEAAVVSEGAVVPEGAVVSEGAVVCECSVSSVDFVVCDGIVVSVGGTMTIDGRHTSP